MHDTPGEMPPFGGATGGYYYSLPLKPPFSITNLTTRLFSLRASLTVLQGFCDNYLNILPEEVGRFRVFTPYVQLMIMDYGGLALEVTNLGWFAQREVMFGVPVEWYKVVNGKWIFHDWAVIPAYIFVDDELSLPMGRTVAGWPKTKIQVSATKSGAMHDPLGPVNEGTLSAKVFAELYSGARQEERVFLEIQRSSPASMFGLPPNPRNPTAPWEMWSRSVNSMVSLGRDSMNWLAGLGMMPMRPGTNPENFVAMMSRATGMTNPLQPNLGANVINLKQFRSADQPSRYCYQAATVGSMKFTKMNALGLLGEQSLMLGDLSGGYTIRFHEWPSLPIVRSLGLEVDRKWRGDGVDVAEVKPVMPLWYDCDMRYDLGENLAWRSYDGVWHGQDGEKYEPKDPETAFLYNTTLGPNTKPIAGPFHFYGTTVRVLPLLADYDTLDKFLDGYINAPLGTSVDEENEPEAGAERFKVWASPKDDLAGDDADTRSTGQRFAYVYLTATSFGDVTSETNNIGDWASRELSYLIPVKRERWDHKTRKWTLIGVGVIPPFVFTDNVAAAIAGREVLGFPATAADFVETESSWMSEEGPATYAEQPLLRVEGEVLPVIGEGGEAVTCPIVEILSGVTPDADDHEFWSTTGDIWGHMLRHELERKKDLHRAPKGDKGKHLKRARALALETLSGRMPLSYYTLKQFRDNQDPDRACYQSLVRVQRTLAKVLDMREIEEPILVRMHDYPARAIVKTLGLIGKQIQTREPGIVYGLKPVRPFWIRVTMAEALGEELTFRAGEHEWCPPPSATGTPDSDDLYLRGDSSGNVGVGASLSDVLDHGDPRRMPKAMMDWVESGETPMSVEDAKVALGETDPQTVLESILSREWGNWDPTNRWRLSRRELAKGYEVILGGARDWSVKGDKEASSSEDKSPSSWVHKVETGYFRDVIKKVRARPGVPRPHLPRNKTIDALVKEWKKEGNWNKSQGSATHEELMLARLQQFTKLRMELETPWSALWRDQTSAALEGPIKAISHLAIIGQPSTPEREDDAEGQDNLARLTVLIEETFEPAPKDVPPEKLTWLVAIALERCILQRDAVLNHVAKGRQKPDFCIRRDFAGPEKERIFPRADSWDRTWYVGPDDPEDRPAIK